MNSFYFPRLMFYKFHQAILNSAQSVKNFQQKPQQNGAKNKMIISHNDVSLGKVLNRIDRSELEGNQQKRPAEIRQISVFEKQPIYECCRLLTLLHLFYGFSSAVRPESAGSGALCQCTPGPGPSSLRIPQVFLYKYYDNNCYLFAKLNVLFHEISVAGPVPAL